MDDEVPVFVEIQEPKGGSAFQPYYAPETLEEFFQIEGLFQVLAKSLVFIHNRKDSSDWLIEAARQASGGSYSFRFFQTHVTEWSSILDEIIQADGGIDEIYVIDITTVPEDQGRFCATISALEDLARGVWIRGYIRDISPSILQLFDFLFLFDMSDSEFGVLRSVISVSSEQIEQVRDYTDRTSITDIILIFINYGRVRGVPMLAYNPMTLFHVRGYRGPMDITPFVPVIVEATKFVFNEVSKWIDDMRQHAAQGSTYPVGSILPVTKEQFVAAESNQESIALLLSRATTLADIDEIRNLLGQLKKRRALFLELESQEVTASGAEAAKLRVQMQDVARDILKNVNRLERSLSRVYRSK